MLTPECLKACKNELPHSCNSSRSLEREPYRHFEFINPPLTTSITFGKPTLHRKVTRNRNSSPDVSEHLRDSLTVNIDRYHLLCLTCSISGWTGLYRHLVSMCSGTKLNVCRIWRAKRSWAGPTSPAGGVPSSVIGKKLSKNSCQQDHHEEANN